MTKQNLFLSLAIVLVSGLNLNAAHAAWNQGQEPGDEVYMEGNENVRLSADEISELAAYIDNSYTQLNSVIYETRTMAPQDAVQEYLKAFKNVVKNSYKVSKYSETLLRISLNQALAMTEGIPNRFGVVEAGKAGVLAASGSQNYALMRTILQTSAMIALMYRQTDLDMTRSGSFFYKPYNDLANARLHIAYYKWIDAAVGSEKWRVAYAALQHWINTVYRSDNLNKIKKAEKTVRAQESLDKVDFMSSAAEKEAELKYTILKVLKAEDIPSEVIYNLDRMN